MHKSEAALQKCKDYGYMHMGEWDVLWSITAKAMLAAEILRPGEGRRQHERLHLPPHLMRRPQAQT